MECFFFVPLCLGRFDIFRYLFLSSLHFIWFGLFKMIWIKKKPEDRKYSIFYRRNLQRCRIHTETISKNIRDIRKILVLINLHIIPNIFKGKLSGRQGCIAMLCKILPLSIYWIWGKWKLHQKLKYLGGNSDRLRICEEGLPNNWMYYYEGFVW